jgi:DNA-binding transcriptional regulator YiaG
MTSMATLKQLREQTGLTVSELARRANIDYRTAKKADENGPVFRIKALALLKVINQELGTKLTIEDIDELEVQ